MAKLSIRIILMISSLLIAMQITGNYARREAALDVDEAEALFQNIPGGNEKLAKIHFYVQDVLDGPNTTVHEVARAAITSESRTAFGQVRVVDDLITVEPDFNSTKLGRAQGLITFSDLETSALTMELNIVFTSGKYNGSTICVLGRNQLSMRQRELAVVGGTGLFRFTRGYAITSLHSYDDQAGYGVLEYTVYATYVDKSKYVRLQADT